MDWGGWRWAFFVNIPIGIAALVPARRLLREIREPEGARLPDALGTLMLGAGVGLVALGIVEGPDWGWGSARVLGALGTGRRCCRCVVWRSARHPSPVIELGLFRVRSFAVANAGMFTFSAAFYALLLANVLFTTEVWGWTILEAGVAVTPAPAMAALTGPGGGPARGPLRPAGGGGARSAAVRRRAACSSRGSMDATPDYVSELLPGQLLTGSGVGFSFAAWGSAAVAGLPPARFATGSAVLACLRQVGAVLGIAVLVAVLDERLAGRSRRRLPARRGG